MRLPQFGRLVRPLERAVSSYPCPPLELPKPSLDWGQLSDPANLGSIQSNIDIKKSRADIRRVQELFKEIYLNTCIHDTKSEVGREATEANLLAAALQVPNMCSQHSVDLGTDNKVLYEKPFTNPEFKVRKFEDVARILSGARLTNLGVTSGERAYHLMGPLAELELALVQWATDALVERGWRFLGVPDILHPGVVEACGMKVEGERTQVYRLAQGGAALAGTAEMSIGGYLAGRQVEERPLKLAAVSRCYRAETSRTKDEGGLYRVHTFTKVEMFVVTEGKPEASEAALAEVLALQQELFSSLGLAHRVLAMCPEELGDPATTKYDVEAWLPGRGFWGEISSCSDCTDYQARRLALTQADGSFCHTVNGTACAVPRMILAICEQFQTASGAVAVPEVLRPYLRGRELLEPLAKKQRPNFQWIPGATWLEGRE